MNNLLKSFIATNVIGALMFSLLVVASPVAMAEECPKNDLTKIFFEEYYGDVKWDNRVSPKEITWSTEVSSVNSAVVARKFTDAESGWLQESFDSWDIALDTISFKRVTDGLSAKIQVGLVAINNNGYWVVEQRGNYRETGAIQLSTISPFLTTRNGFIEAAQSEIGNLLGLGDIAESAALDSVLKDPDTAPYGSIPLSDFDIDLIRQFYGESTCHSTWSQSLRDSKAAAEAALIAQKAAAEAALIAQKAAAEAALAKAAEEAQAKLDAESREALTKLALEVEMARRAEEKTARAEIATFKASLKSKKTITCVKGKILKKVTAAAPKCPAGYTKK
jgi:hypothetical protein